MFQSSSDVSFLVTFTDIEVNQSVTTINCQNLLTVNKFKLFDIYLYFSTTVIWVYVIFFLIYGL